MSGERMVKGWSTTRIEFAPSSVSLGEAVLVLDSERRRVRRALRLPLRSRIPRPADGSARTSGTGSSSSSMRCPSFRPTRSSGPGSPPRSRTSCDAARPHARAPRERDAPRADVDELVEQAQQEVHQARELIDDVLFLGELETGAK